MICESNCTFFFLKGGRHENDFNDAPHRAYLDPMLKYGTVMVTGSSGAEVELPVFSGENFIFDMLSVGTADRNNRAVVVDNKLAIARYRDSTQCSPSS